MLEAQVVSQRYVHNLDSHGNERPTFVADVRFVAACPDLVIICQIDIEDELFGERSECGGFSERLTISWVSRVDWTDLEAGWIQPEDVLSEAKDRQICQSALAILKNFTGLKWGSSDIEGKRRSAE